MDSKGYRK